MTPPRWLIMAMLVVPPIVMGAVAIALLSLAGSWRKSWGAQSSVNAAAIPIAGVALLLHAGYALAPRLHATGRTALGLWVTIPLAIIVTVLVLGWIGLNADSSGGDGSGGKWWLWAPLGLIVVYWTPVVALLIGR